MWSAVEQRWSAIHQRGREKSPAVRIGYPCCHVVSGICVLSSVLPRVSISVCVVCSLCPPSLYLITSVSLRFWPFSFFFSLSIDRKLLVPLEIGCALECYAHTHAVAQQWACSDDDKHPGISEGKTLYVFESILFGVGVSTHGRETQEMENQKKLFVFFQLLHAIFVAIFGSCFGYVIRTFHDFYTWIPSTGTLMHKDVSLGEKSGWVHPISHNLLTAVKPPFQCAVYI